MRKASTKVMKDNLRPEYDLRKLKGGVRGKYYERVQAGTNLVLLEPDLAKAFPDADSVNRALRVLLDAASATAGQRSGKASSRLKRSARKRVVA